MRAVTMVFILGVAILLCAAASKQDGWKKIENRSFSFSVPSSFKKTGARGVDSFVEEYVTERIKLSFDYGWYSNNFDDWPKDTKFEDLKVNGKDARIGTVAHAFHKGFPYSTQIHIKLDGGMALSMFAACKSEEEVALAVSLRWPSGMATPIAALPFARDFCASRNNRKNHSGASAIGAVFFQLYRLPLV